MGTIQRAVQILAGTYDKDLLSFEVAQVITVDTQNWLCTVQLVSGNRQTTYTNVQLTAEKASNGFIQVPKVNSNVILALTFRNERYVFMCSEVDALVFHQKNSDNSYEEFVINCNPGFNSSLPLGVQIVDGGGNGIVISSKGIIKMNQGSYGGLAIVAGTNGLQNQLNYMNAQLQKVISLLQTNAYASLQGSSASEGFGTPLLPNADFSNIENSDITHGPSIT